MASPLPFQFTVELCTKLLPFTVSVKAGLPTAALVGESEVVAGNGLLQLNIRAGDEVPPPGIGLKTATVAGPAVVQSVAGTVAFSCVAVWEVIARLLPFHITWEDETKLVPFTVSVKGAVLTIALAGKSGEVVVGTGLLTQNEIGEEVPPEVTPGAVKTLIG